MDFFYLENREKEGGLCKDEALQRKTRCQYTETQIDQGMPVDVYTGKAVYSR